MSTGKGKKRMRGKPVLHKELKKQHGLWLTSEAWEKVKRLAKLKSTSASEIVEELIRNAKGG